MSEGEISIRTYPGGSSFSANPEGGYTRASCVLGGCGGGRETAESVAAFFAARATEHDGYLQQMEALGWTDVVAVYRKILDGQRREKRRKRIEELRKNIAYAQPLHDQNRHKDESWWSGKIYDQMASHPDFNPEEFSARRLQNAVRSAMGFVASLPQMKEELARLCEEAGADSAQEIA